MSEVAPLFAVRTTTITATITTTLPGMGKVDKGMQHLCKYLSIVVLLYIQTYTNRLLSLALILDLLRSRSPKKFTDLAD